MDTTQPIWCNLITDKNLVVLLERGDIKELKNVVDASHQHRVNVFKNLMKDKHGDLDMDFISYFKSLLDVDVPCLCDNLVEKVSKMGGVDMTFYIGNEFARAATGIALLMCAREKDCRWILKGMPNSRLYDYISVRVVPPAGDNCNLWSIKTYKGGKSEAFITAGGPAFPNQTCLHMALNEILGDNPNYVYQYDAFFCGTTGYNITEFAIYGDLSKYLNEEYKGYITDDFIIDMLKQIFTPLFILKQDKYQFNHSDLKTRNVFVGEDSQKKPVYKLADFDKSAIFWNGVRFYNNDYDYQKTGVNVEYIYKTLFSNLVTETNEYYNFNVVRTGVGYFKTDEDLVGNHMQMYTMHNRRPTFMSYDFYTFLFSLMLEPRIYEFAQKNPGSLFVNVWNNMWHPEDLENVNKVMELAYKHVKLEKKVKLWYIKNKIGINNFRLKKDVGFLRNMLRLHVPDVECKENRRLLNISNDEHICVNKCDKKDSWGYKYCNTNRYSKKGLPYDWDYCKP